MGCDHEAYIHALRVISGSHLFAARLLLMATRVATRQSSIVPTLCEYSKSYVFDSAREIESLLIESAWPTAQSGDPSIEFAAQLQLHKHKPRASKQPAIAHSGLPDHFIIPVD